MFSTNLLYNKIILIFYYYSNYSLSDIKFLVILFFSEDICVCISTLLKAVCSSQWIAVKSFKGKKKSVMAESNQLAQCR